MAADNRHFWCYSYIYDTESYLYYLQSRYYDPAIGRFINADALASTGQGLLGNNMFAYCGNNPLSRSDYSGNAWETAWDVASFISSASDFIANPNLWTFACVSGDFIDVLVPIVGGVGETIKAVSVAVKAADAVDDAVDTVSMAKKGWNLGDDITNLTKAGKTPSWSTVRQRYWKNEAYINPCKYATNDLKRMKKGLAPQLELNGRLYSKELHHIKARHKGGSNAYDNLLPVWPWEHAEIDPFRYF